MEEVENGKWKEKKYYTEARAYLPALVFLSSA